MLKATLAEAIAGTNNTKFLTPYLASNLPFIRGSKSGPFTLTDLVWTKITSPTIVGQIGNYWNPATNQLILPAGIYSISITAEIVGSTSTFVAAGNIYFNGSASGEGFRAIGVATGGPIKPSFNQALAVNGTDVLEFYALANGPGTLTLNSFYFTVFKIR
jgi:hypothetical protein